MRTSIAGKAIAILELVRLHNVLVSVVTTYVGYATLTYYYINSRPFDESFLIAAIVVALVAAGGYAINDYFDIKIDKVNKPWRPLPSGRISANTAYKLAIILFATGIIIAYIYAGLLSGSYALMTALLLYLYSQRLKRSGVLGNIIVAFNSASTIFYGGLVAAEMNGLYKLLWKPFLPFTYAFLLVLGREVVKGIEDYEGDRLANVRTIAVVLGPLKARIVTLIILVLVISISPLPYLLRVYNIYYMLLASIVDALILASLIILFAGGNSDSKVIKEAGLARSILKWGFLVGALAFIAGLF
ncbi:MAG: geranylgeranylglycerol-phosphate geranylgeranyltransferase [Pyrodictiaceae archaeon]